MSFRIILAMAIGFLMMSCRGQNDVQGKSLPDQLVTPEQTEKIRQLMTVWKLPAEFARSEVAGCHVQLVIPHASMSLNRADLVSASASWVFMWKAEGENCSGDYLLRYQGTQSSGVLRLNANTDKKFGSFSKTQGIFYWNAQTMEDVKLDANPEGYLFWNVEDLGSHAQPEPNKVKLL